MDNYINIFTYESKQKNKKYIRLFIYLLFLTSLIALIILISILIKWNKDNKSTNTQIEEINNLVKVREINNNEENTNDIQNINPPINNDTSDYWYYINMPLIDVNFNNLLEINKDTIAWINLPGTNINYPVVQSNDNDYYLKHSFKKESTDAGWIFMDYRNNSSFNDKNTIIYGHSRLNKTMFGTLKNVITKEWYNNRENHIVKISTPSCNYLFQVFSTYKIETENYYLTTNFNNDDEYKKFLNSITNRSIFNFNTAIDENDKIITLSTCSSNNYKVVLHAKLIKIQNK